jgi:hypothetical protein
MNDKKREIIEALGAASMCWDPKPTGCFDSTRALAIADGLYMELELDTRPTPTPTSEYVKALEVERDMWKMRAEMAVGLVKPTEADMTWAKALLAHPTPAKEPCGEVEKAAEAGRIEGAEAILRAIPDWYGPNAPESILLWFQNFKAWLNRKDTIPKALAAYHAQVTKEGSDGK